MNQIQSISADVKNNIDINNSRATALVDALSLQEQELIALQNKFNLIIIAMKAKASPNALAEMAGIL